MRQPLAGVQAERRQRMLIVKGIHTEDLVDRCRSAQHGRSATFPTLCSHLELDPCRSSRSPRTSPLATARPCSPSSMAIDLLAPPAFARETERMPVPQPISTTLYPGAVLVDGRAVAHDAHRVAQHAEMGGGGAEPLRRQVRARSSLGGDEKALFEQDVHQLFEAGLLDLPILAQTLEGGPGRRYRGELQKGRQSVRVHLRGPARQRGRADQPAAAPRPPASKSVRWHTKCPNPWFFLLLQDPSGQDHPHAHRHQHHGEDLARGHRLAEENPAGEEGHEVADPPLQGLDRADVHQAAPGAGGRGRPS